MKRGMMGLVLVGLTLALMAPSKCGKVCQLDPNLPGCPPPTPQCTGNCAVLPDGTTPCCSCWEISGRTGGKWEWMPACPLLPSPSPSPGQCICPGLCPCDPPYSGDYLCRCQPPYPPGSAECDRCFPSPSPSPLPSPTPGPSPEPSLTPPAPSPTPGSAFNCNGEYEVPSCEPYNKVEVIGGPGLMGDCKVGQKCTMNSSPKMFDPRCTRGAVIPGMCVVEGSPVCHVPTWTVSPAVEIHAEYEQCGYLAQWKPLHAGVYIVQVCMPPAGCRSTTVNVSD